MIELTRRCRAKAFARALDVDLIEGRYRSAPNDELFRNTCGFGMTFSAPIAH